MASNKNIKYKCPYCDKRFTRIDMVNHVAEIHDDMIPEGFTPLRIVFNSINKYPLDYNGKCTECGGPTDWDENKGRYNRQCRNPKCKEQYLKRFEANMKNATGSSDRISSTAEGQAKLLAGRKISGKYKFQNGEEKPYVGSYELNTLKFMDKVMNINPDDILAPGPILNYEYEGKTHMYITDFLYIPYNLIIEVKDGGSNPNKRNMPEYRAKQIAKEEYIIKNTNYNYIRLTNNDLSQLLTVFMDIKMSLLDESKERVIHINEAMNALMTGYIPSMDSKDSVYVVNYLQNNVFSGEAKRGYGVSNSPKLTNLIIRDVEGCLNKAPDDFLENCNYDVYCVNISPYELSNKLNSYIGEFVSESFLYESLFGKKMYTYDQIMTEKKAIPIVDYYKSLEMLKEATYNFIIGKDDNILKENDGFISLKNGDYYVESTSIEDLYLRSDIRKSNSDEKAFLEGLCFRKEKYNG